MVEMIDKMLSEKLQPFFDQVLSKLSATKDHETQDHDSGDFDLGDEDNCSNEPATLPPGGGATAPGDHEGHRQEEAGADDDASIDGRGAGAAVVVFREDDTCPGQSTQAKTSFV